MNRKKIVIGSTGVVAAGWMLYQLRRRRSARPWTTADMPAMTGQVVIVTGANSGIGFETAKAFARQGAHTILACRNMSRAQAAMAAIQAALPASRLAIIPLDLASLVAIRRFAAAFLAEYDRLDVLVNNAGVGGVPYITTEDGFELQWGVNHLGHFALTGLLLDALRGTPGARVVTVSSVAHWIAAFRGDVVLSSAQNYSMARAYARSKLANLLFTYELQRRLAASGSGVIAVAAHPGGVNTRMTKQILERAGDAWWMRGMRVILTHILQSEAMGALPILRAAVDPHVQGGEYYGPDGLLGGMGYPVRVSSSRASYNVATAGRLWDVSAQLTGVPYLS